MALLVGKSSRFDLMILAILSTAIILGSMLSGPVLYRSGHIQLFSIGFIILAAVRAMTNYRLYDPALKKIVTGGLLSLVLFAQAYLTAYLGKQIWQVPDDATVAVIVNFHLAGLLIQIIWIGLALKTYLRRPVFLIRLPSLGLLMLLATTTAFLLRKLPIDLLPGTMLNIYVMLLAAVASFALLELLRARQLLPVLSSFIDYLLAGTLMVAFSALLILLAPSFVNVYAAPEIIIGNLSIYPFFLGASLMFLSFGRIKRLGGVYEGIQKEETAPVLTNPEAL